MEQQQTTPINTTNRLLLTDYQIKRSVTNLTRVTIEAIVPEPPTKNQSEIVAAISTLLEHGKIDLVIGDPDRPRCQYCGKLNHVEAMDCEFCGGVF
jgi:hypothetical protein